MSKSFVKRELGRRRDLYVRSQEIQTCKLTRSQVLLKRSDICVSKAPLLYLRVEINSLLSGMNVPMIVSLLVLGTTDVNAVETSVQP